MRFPTSSFFSKIVLPILCCATLAMQAQQSDYPRIKTIPVVSGTATKENNDGFLNTHWTQDGEYSQFCPMDPVTQMRSYAGCPAVAMGMIVNHLRTINGSRMSDSDDYLHNYAGRYFTIDDDWERVKFASFETLNNYLANADSLWALNIDATDKEAAAIVFACGVACTQVFTSEGSGTFSVQQAFNGYRRMGFDSCQLFYEPSDEMFAILNANLDCGIPAHLAVESPDGMSGHNVVVDGRRDDSTYHVNFGFGGPLDGWYRIPDPDFPYELTKMEGIIVNLAPSSPLAVEQPQQQHLNIFPNPAHGWMRVEGADNGMVKIYDAIGHQVLQAPTNTTIDINALAPGLYIVKVQGKTAKLIIQ